MEKSLKKNPHSTGCHEFTFNNHLVRLNRAEKGQWYELWVYSPDRSKGIQFLILPQTGLKTWRSLIKDCIAGLSV